MAISDYNPTEQQRLSYLAREYRQNGYDVHIYPDASSLPSTLTSFIIGLAAQKKEELIFAEVRTRDRLGLGGNRDLRAIAKCIEGIPNADWELVLTSKQIRF